MDAYTPICYDCHVLMAFTFEPAMVAYPEDNPRNIWAADVYECPRCHKRVIAGQAQEPLVQNDPEGFAHYAEKYSSDLFILKG